MPEKRCVANHWITEHLAAWEVQCRCGQCDGGTIRAELAVLFEEIREACYKFSGVETPIKVTSGVRCPCHPLSRENPKSKHISGMALDLLTPRKLHLTDFWEICDRTNPNGGVGFYNWWRDGGKVVGGCHVDIWTEPKGRRWWQGGDRKYHSGKPDMRYQP